MRSSLKNTLIIKVVRCFSLRCHSIKVITHILKYDFSFPSITTGLKDSAGKAPTKSRAAAISVTKWVIPVSLFHLLLKEALGTCLCLLAMGALIFSCWGLSCIPYPSSLSPLLLSAIRKNFKGDHYWKN